MKRDSIQYFAIICLTLFVWFPKCSFGSHAMNMEMFYRHTTDSSYEFTLVFYRSCYGFTGVAPMSVSINASSVSKNITGSFTCTRLPTSGFGVPSLFPPNLFNCLDTALCAEEYVYRGIWTSPERANDWVFSYDVCCYPVAPVLDNVPNQRIYVEAGLDNLTFPDTLHKNLSPIFHNRRPNHPNRSTDTIYNPPVISVCQGRNVFIDQSVVEYDGDSVSYEFFIPQTMSGNNTTYINGYSFSNPISSQSGSPVMDSINGSFQFIPGVPDSSGLYLLGVKTTEYRNDTIVSGGSYTVIKKPIGFIKRNLLIVIEDSATCNDEVLTFSDENMGNPIDSISFDCPYDSFDIKLTDYFWCTSVDTDASCIQIRHSSSASILPLKRLKSLQCEANQLTKQIRIFLDTNILADTFELVFKRGTDGNSILSECFMEMPAYQDTLVLVFEDQPTGAFTGDYIHTGGKWANKEVCGDTTFTLIMTEKFLCSSVSTDGSEFKVTDPSGSIHQIKSWNINCKKGLADSIQFTIFPGLMPGLSMVKLENGSDTDKLLNVCTKEWKSDSIYLQIDEVKPNLGKDTIVCEEDSSWTITLNAGNYYAYTWSSGQTSRSIQISDTGAYSVTVYNDYFCSGADTIQIMSKKCYTGVYDKNSNAILKIYPNPGNGLFTLTSSGLSGKESLEVFNSSGRKIRSIDQISLESFTIDLTNESDGLYFINVVSEKEVIFKDQVIIQK